MSVCADLPFSTEQLCWCFPDSFMRLAVNSWESQRRVLVCRLWSGDIIVQQSSRVGVCCYCRGGLAVMYWSVLRGSADGFFALVFLQHAQQKTLLQRTNRLGNICDMLSQQLGDLSTNRTAKAAFIQSVHPAGQRPWHERHNVGKHLLWQCPCAR